MDVKAIQARLAAHAVERNWDPFFSPRSLSMAVAAEAGALLAVFQWLSEDQTRRVGMTQDRETVAKAIADIVLYSLRLAETVDVDVDEAVLARATEKYPVSARRFEGVDDMDALESTFEPRESTSAAVSAVPQAPPLPRTGDSDSARTPLRAAPARGEPVMPAPLAPRNARLIPEVEAELEEERAIEVDPPEVEAAPPEVEAAPPPDSAVPQSRGRPDSAARERSDSPRRAKQEPPPRERVETPARERTEPPARAERYANLDTDAVLDLLKGLKKRIDDSRSDDTVLHEIKDEMDTLRRNVYSSKSKPAWIAGGLERLGALLAEAAVQPVGDKVNFKDYIGRISRLLEG